MKFRFTLPIEVSFAWRRRRGATFFVADNACGRKGSSNFGLCGKVSLQPSVELEVAHRSEFSTLGRSRAEPESAQSLRVWSMDRRICPSRRHVSIPALQQTIFNAGRAIVERMIRYQGRLTQLSSSSQDRLRSLTSTCHSCWERTLSMVFAFTLRVYRATYVSTLPTDRVGAPSGESSKTHRQSQLIRAERSSNGS